MQNAEYHKNASVILNVDLENFFESISEKRVYGIFKSLGYCKNLSVDLAKICTVSITDDKYQSLSDEGKKYFKFYKDLEEPVLIQGAPTSPSLSNLICRKLDCRLSKLANKLGACYSRYADDITFSGNRENIPHIKILKKIINEEGFNINREKIGQYKRGQKQMVTGLLIDNDIRIPQKFKKEIYRHLHFCKKYGAKAHFDKICPNKSYRKEWILGKIRYVYSIEPEEAKKMYKIIDEIDWEI